MIELTLANQLASAQPYEWICFVCVCLSIVLLVLDFKILHHFFLMMGMIAPIVNFIVYGMPITAFICIVIIIMEFYYFAQGLTKSINK